MPKRKVIDPADTSPEALARLQETRASGGRRLTAKEVREFQRHCAALPIVDESGTWADDSAWCITRRHAFFIDMRPSDSGKPVDPKYKTLVMRRRGRIVYREPGKAGADLEMPPWAYRTAIAERDRLVEQAKRLRQPRLLLARRMQADALCRRILALAEVDTTRGRNKRIARAAGCSLRTVERVLAENRHTKIR